MSTNVKQEIKETDLYKAVPELKAFDEDEAIQLVRKFESPLAEAEKLNKRFDDMMSRKESEGITEELCKEARELRLKYRPIRTGADKTKKAKKEFFVQANKAIDGLYKMVEITIKEKEAECEAIEKFYENKEKELRAELKEKREAEISEFVEEIPVGIENLDEKMYSLLLEGAKKAKAEADKAAEAERKRLEAEEKARQEQEAERLRQLKERQAEIDKLKAKEKAQKLKMEEGNNRVKKLLRIGVNISLEKAMEYSSEDFNKRYKAAKQKYDKKQETERLAKEKEAEKLKELEEIEKAKKERARKERLSDDKTLLIMYLDDLSQVKVPTLKNEESETIKKGLTSRVNKLISDAKDYVNATLS